MGAAGAAGQDQVVDKRNNPASPSPAVEENGVYVFFPDYGLIAYDASGRELWKMPLGPFNNIYGMGASPVIVGDLLVLACDQSLGSYLMAPRQAHRQGPVEGRSARSQAATRRRFSGGRRTARINHPAGLVPPDVA